MLCLLISGRYSLTLKLPTSLLAFMSLGLGLLKSVEALLLITAGHVWAQPEHRWSWNSSFFFCFLIYTFGLWFNCASFTQTPHLPPALLHAATFAPFGIPVFTWVLSYLFLTPGKNSHAALDHLNHPSNLPSAVAISRLLRKIKNRLTYWLFLH